MVEGQSQFLSKADLGKSRGPELCGSPNPSSGDR